MKKILNYLKKYKLNLIFGPIFKLLEAIIEITLPIIIAFLIDNYNNFSTNELIYYLVFLLVLVVLGFVFASIAQYIAAKTSQGFSKTLRENLFTHINQVPTYKLNHLGTSAIVNRIINDVTNLETGVAMFIRLVIRIPFIFIGSIIMIFIISPKLALIVLASSIILFLVIFIIVKIASKLYSKSNYFLDKISLKIKENLVNIKLIRSFVTQTKEYDKFNKINNSNFHFSKLANIVSNLLNPISILILNLTILLILNLSNSMILGEFLTKGELIAIINYITEMLLAVIVLSNLVTIYTKCFSSSKRVIEILNLEPATNTGILNKFEDNNTAIELDNVSFSYNTNKFLENLSLQIKQGEIVGFIGLTASGKTTILNLLNKNISAKSGYVKVFGKNIDEYENSFLKRKIYLINQHPFFITDTIFENISLGRTSEDSTIWNALALSEAKDFVTKYPDKLNHVLVNNASNLSGGQKQRLNIARAFVGNPSIILFDDITSSLDIVTENNVITNLFNYLKTNHITGLISSQKISTIKNCDKIVLLDDGKILDIGTHKELLERSELYNEILKYSSQGDNNENI